MTSSPRARVGGRDDRGDLACGRFRLIHRGLIADAEAVKVME
jgi:hypothetical protein